MISIHDLERHFSYIDPALLEIILELRNLVAELAPQATERILRSGLSYHDASRGGPVKAGICGIQIEPDAIRLTFNLGAFLPDPTGLLQADEGRLAKRFLLIHSYAEAPWEDLRNLMAAACRLDPASFSPQQIEAARKATSRQL